MKAETDAPLCLPPLPLGHLPQTLLPEGTCDTHFHVFSPDAPLAWPRSYTPQMMPLTAWQEFARGINMARGVLVQPSVYGLNNSVLLEALAADPEHLRAIVVLPPETATAELQRLDRLGVRGIRVNTRNKGGLPLSAVPELAARMAELDWLLQFQVNPDQLAEIATLAPLLPCPIVLDHLGFIPLGKPETRTYFTALQKLLDTGRCFVKVSASYRLDAAPDYMAFGALVRQLAASHPERLLWGSDWPHTEMWDHMPDDAHLIDLMQDWLASANTRRLAFVANADKLFFAR